MMNKKGIAFQTLTTLIIAVLVLVTVLFAYFIYTNKGFKGMGQIYQTGETKVNTTVEALKVTYTECIYWLQQKECDKFNQYNCDKITGMQCQS